MKATGRSGGATGRVNFGIKTSFDLNGAILIIV